MKLNPISLDAQSIRARRSVKSPQPQLRSERKPYKEMLNPAMRPPCASDSGRYALSDRRSGDARPDGSPSAATVSV